MSAIAARIRGIDLSALDGVIAVALALDLILESLLAHGVPDRYRVLTALFAVPFAATIAVRRRSPGGALIACTGVALLQQLLHGQLFVSLPSESAELGPILCAYGAGAWLAPRRGLAAAAVAGALLFLVSVVSDAQHAPGAPGLGGGLAIVVFFVAGPLAVGWVVQSRNRRADAFTELERQVTAERAEFEHAAIAEERVVIGRELQDIIAHSVSTMVVQAAGARRLLTAQPERARESLVTVEQTGRETLAEMRRMLGVLRRDDDPRALAPQPGLDQLPELAELVRARGLSCQLGVGELGGLTPGIDLVAYRVVEAALGHAAEGGCRDATVAIRRRSGTLELDVRTDRAIPEATVALGPVAERVALYDGRLEIDELEDQPLTVHCRLPLGAGVAG
jgi:signal transduction histidine kinase